MAIALQRASVILAHSFETGEPVEIDEEQLTAGAVVPCTSPASPLQRSRDATSKAQHLADGKRIQDAVSVLNLLDAWWTEAKAVGRKPSTFESYRNTVAAFIDFLGHEDAARVVGADVVAFKDHRLSTPSKRTGKPPSAKTVKDSDLSALKTLFGWAVINRKLASNPASGITIKFAKNLTQKPTYVRAA